MLAKGSFSEQVALKSKTDKLFGLDKADSSLRPQKQGWLLKKPFRSSSNFSTDKIPRKKWFAVKDSFIFWWDAETREEVGFDTHPKGAIPLGGASIKIHEDKLTIEMRHPVFPKNDALIMKAADYFEAMEWLDVIQAGMKATWENAILGFALIEKLKAKGSELEGEKEDALLKAQEEAARLDSERDEAARLAEMKEAQASLHEQEVAQVDDKVGELKKQVSLKEGERDQEKKAYEKEKMMREKLEKELRDAQDALAEIEAAFETFEEHRLRELTKEKLRHETEVRKRKTMIPPTKDEQAAMIKAAEEYVKSSTQSVFKDDEQVRKNVVALREYFEATAKTHEMRRKALAVRKN